MKLFHYTTKEGYSSIQREGFIRPSQSGHYGPGLCGKYGPGVYLTDLDPEEFQERDIAESLWQGGASNRMREGRMDRHVCVEIPDDELLRPSPNLFIYVNPYSGKRGGLRLLEYEVISEGEFSAYNGAMVSAAIGVAAIGATVAIGQALYESAKTREQERTLQLEEELQTLLSSWNFEKSFETRVNSEGTSVGIFCKKCSQKEPINEEYHGGLCYADPIDEQILKSSLVAHTKHKPKSVESARPKSQIKPHVVKERALVNSTPNKLNFLTGEQRRTLQLQVELDSLIFRWGFAKLYETCLDERGSFAIIVTRRIKPPERVGSKFFGGVLYKDKIDEATLYQDLLHNAKYGPKISNEQKRTLHLKKQIDDLLSRRKLYCGLYETRMNSDRTCVSLFCKKCHSDSSFDFTRTFCGGKWYADDVDCYKLSDSMDSHAWIHPLSHPHFWFILWASVGSFIAYAAWQSIAMLQAHENEMERQRQAERIMAMKWYNFG